jgi:hypothetical protein
MIEIDKSIGFWDGKNTTPLDDLAYAIYCKCMYDLYSPYNVPQNQYLVRQEYFFNDKKIMKFFYDESKITLRKYKINRIKEKNG